MQLIDLFNRMYIVHCELETAFKFRLKNHRNTERFRHLVIIFAKNLPDRTSE